MEVFCDETSSKVPAEGGNDLIEAYQLEYILENERAGFQFLGHQIYQTNMLHSLISVSHTQGDVRG